MKIKSLVKISFLSAILCVCGPLSISIPLSPVPISLTNFVLLIFIYISNTKYTVISYILYMMIGFIGLPVFSNFQGGAAKLLGPTGGYIIGMIMMVLVAGYFINKFKKNKIVCLIGMVMGNIILYIFGSAWLSYQMHITIMKAIALGVLPFVVGDVVKIIIVVLIGEKLSDMSKKLL